VADIITLVSASQGGKRSIALLVNPSSGGGGGPDVEAELRSRGADVHSYEIGEHEAVAAAGADRIVVAGGDGSIGCAAAGAARAGVPLAVVAVGTANDFARALELPDDVEEACELAVTGRRTRPLDLAWMDGRPFLNVASAGLAPEAAREATSWKDRLGPLAYALGALRAGLTASPVDCQVRCDSAEVYSGRAWQITVACSGAFGAGSSVDADPADAKLDVVVIEARSRVALIKHAHGLSGGSIEEQRGVHSARGRVAEVGVAAATPFNVDGEVVEAGSSRFKLEPRAFDLVVG